MAALFLCVNIENKICWVFNNALKGLNCYQTRVNRRNYSADKNGNSEKTDSKKYSHTVHLPKTKFALWLDPKDRVSHENVLMKKCNFLNFYKWQKENCKGKDFILHDGPPYANGQPHVGHAVNKILKDIILRRKSLEGHRVQYVPGWDCHGLPIELKAISEKELGKSLTVLQIRESAHKFAEEAICIQRSAFQSWAVMGDWDNCYFTFDKSYVKNQLKRFYELYEKGLIYRDMKPIYWSPSSRTALAEAELEYNPNHKSTCFTVRLKLNELPLGVKCQGPLYALVWTTTPWTLPANEAVVYGSHLDYNIVKIEGLDGHYIVSKNLVSSLSNDLSKEIDVVQHIPGSSLQDLTYRHPFFDDKVYKFLDGEFVTDDKGTGLVHCAPAHGKDDYLLAVAHKLPLVSLINEDGNYLETAGPKLTGKHILDDGLKAVQEILGSDLIYHSELVHSYPYDWRTKKPVVMLASCQWFFDTNAIKGMAAEQLEGVQFIYGNKEDLCNQVLKRPFWCISRQRVWGVPIPVFFEQDCKHPIVSRALIDHYCNLVDIHGTDFWWKLSNKELCPQSLTPDIDQTAINIVRGDDILDIWFDSGLSWSAVIPNQIADIYLEGTDQNTGWFQSSLLTSIALRGKAPYKTIFTHGFVVDKDGNKMSKSLGNVIDPQVITQGGSNKTESPAFGVDTLSYVFKWWVAAHSVQHSNVPISIPLIKLCSENVSKIRRVLRYMLGVLSDFPADFEKKEHVPSYNIDRFMLHSILKEYYEMENLYSNYQYNHICSTVLNFLANDLSGLYLNFTKDRLYCEAYDSVVRRDCQLVILHLLDYILHSLAPITPLLVEEVHLHHPYSKGRESFFERRCRKGPMTYPEEWHQTAIADTITSAYFLRDKVNIARGSLNSWLLHAVVKASPKFTESMQLLLKDQSPEYTQLTEILQVASLTLESVSESESDDDISIELVPVDKKLCPRCRRFCVHDSGELCSRCQGVIRPVAQKESSQLSF